MCGRMRGRLLWQHIRPYADPDSSSYKAASQDSGKLKIKLSAIYWNPNDPIATINGENYRVGEMIQNHRIIEIRKTEVIFEDPMGEKVIIYFYDYLDKPRKRNR